uniref:Uncharacterized protein n=1 Tax=Triticum urartu TaxID=4572 RepID=A0A8R7R5R0_TRIUA
MFDVPGHGRTWNPHTGSYAKGHLIRYDLNTGDVAVLQTRLAYGNGIAISTPNASHCRIYGAVQVAVLAANALDQRVQGGDIRAVCRSPWLDMKQ